MASVAILTGSAISRKALNIVCFDEYPGVNMQQLLDNTEDTFTDINEVLSHLQQ